jgi:putative transposase
MLLTAKERGFAPACVLFDSWYGSLDNLKTIRNLGWFWLTQLKSNRQVDPDRRGNRAISEVEISETGSIVHLKAYGFIKVFKLVSTLFVAQYSMSPSGAMSELERVKFSDMARTIEIYHRGIKQFCRVERCQARRGRAQRNHIGLALRAFLRLEHHSFHKGISRFEAKTSIIREAVRAYLAKPLFTL